MIEIGDNLTLILIIAIFCGVYIAKKIHGRLRRSRNAAVNCNGVILECMCSCANDSFSYSNVHFGNFIKGVNER